MTAETALYWLLIFPLAASPLVYLLGRICVRTAAARGAVAESQECKVLVPARWLSLVVMLLTSVPLVIAAGGVMANGKVSGFIGGIPLLMDGISLVISGSAVLLGTLALIFSMPYMAGDQGEEKFYALFPMLVGTIIGLSCANDLFNLWVWFETMAVSSYLLVAFYTRDRGALEAGIKYLVQSAVGSVFVLMAIAIIFSQTRTLRLDAIAQWPGELNSFFLAAGCLFLVGFGVKTAIVPMHTWLPDAHSQAPSGVSAMLSGVVIEAGLIAMLRSLGNMPGGGVVIWGGLLMGFGALNMLVGNLMALRQTQVKRLLAYSSLSHIGYMLLGFGVAAAFQSPDAAAGSFFHLVTHALMKGMAFLAAGLLLYTLHISRGDHFPLTVDDLNGAATRYPLAAFALSMAVLALGGLPPLAGFMSKWQIFAGSASTQNVAVILLVVFAALNSVLSLGYYAPLVNRLYRLTPSAAVQRGKPTPFAMGLPLVILVVAVAVLGFWPSLVQWVTAPAADTLVAMFSGVEVASISQWFGW
jgi:proton-translocating NADH-quinone oxidoreductase chain N